MTTWHLSPNVIQTETIPFSKDRTKHVPSLKAEINEYCCIPESVASYWKAEELKNYSSSHQGMDYLKYNIFQRTENYLWFPRLAIKTQKSEEKVLLSLLEKTLEDISLNGCLPGIINWVFISTYFSSLDLRVGT